MFAIWKIVLANFATFSQKLKTLIDMKPLMHQDSRPKAKVEGALVLC
jgi:hypothetical protein